MNSAHRATSESKLNGIEVSYRTPDFSNEAFLGHINIAEVQSMVNGFHLAHLYEPNTDILCSSLKNPLTVIFSLVEYLPWEEETLL